MTLGGDEFVRPPVAELDFARLGEIEVRVVRV